MRLKFIWQKIAKTVFSMPAAGFYMIAFAVAVGGATFVENDFGTSAAQKIIYRSTWFEILLTLFCICLMVNILRYRMIQNKKWPILTFHLSIIIILIGSLVTRYASHEGMMHIREGSSSQSILSSETFLNFEVKYDGQTYQYDAPVLFASLGDNSWNESFQFGNSLVKMSVQDFIPNPTQTMITDQNGLPTIKIVIGGQNGREEYFLQFGSQKRFRGDLYNFSSESIPNAIQIVYKNNGLYVTFPATATQMQMSNQRLDTIGAKLEAPLLLRSLYTSGGKSFVIGEFNPKAIVKEVSASRKMKSESIGGVPLSIQVDNEEKTQVLYGQKGVEGRQRLFQFPNIAIKASYGSKKINLPFAIKLRDFELEKYPGTNSASSYASEVTLIDSRNQNSFDYRIYMNNILDYGGYRFFQSSFDQDELGTYLSVNHDFWGTWISYLGYALLTLGMIFTLFHQKSRFTNVRKQLQKIRSTTQTLILTFFFTSLSIMGLCQGQGLSVSDEHAEKLSSLVVQDHRGRLKPLHTMAGEVIRKVSRKSDVNGLSPVHAFIGMAIFPETWTKVPLIKLGHHENIKQLVGNEGPLVSYSDFFNQSGQYKLRDAVRKAHATNNVDRGVFEKELLKIDERMNIINMVLNNKMMRIYPIEDDPNNLWVSPGDLHGHHQNFKTQPYFQKFFQAYSNTVHEASKTDNWQLANDLIDELVLKQKEFGSKVVPSDQKISAELLLNKLQVFSRLGKIYGLLGIYMLFLFFTGVFSPNLQLKWPKKIGWYLIFLAFIFHIIGLALRWYVSGRAPWSNGYESMIYIAFTTMLAGVIFARKSTGGLAATSLLASIILMVASLSYLDPEITPLVPVLKSYWLTIHVSLEAGSYGFLMLGAIIGVINLILFIIRNQKNQKLVNTYIKELTLISELTLTGGLFMISVGTYLGGVWANESWGRYWGWDAKETWALVTILVYAFLLHMRYIPGFRGPFSFNVGSLVGFASVVMTYFGVNYYLSGLHSYAAGDPIPIPVWVYYTTACLTALSIIAFLRKRNLQKSLK